MRTTMWRVLSLWSILAFVLAAPARPAAQVQIVEPATPTWGDLSQPEDLIGQAAIAAAKQSAAHLDLVPGETNWEQVYPSGLKGHAMAYDSARGVVVLFGGEGWDGHLDDTWEWNGTNWTQLSPPNRPSARSVHAMAYDSARGVVVLFGGLDGSGTHRDDTWEWDGTNWMQRGPASQPPARAGHAMAYDSAREVTVLFGGSDQGDTWEWDGTDWVERSPARQPSARSGHAMAYDSVQEAVVLFGGWQTHDTWVYGSSVPRPPLSPIANPDGDGDYLVDWGEVAGATSYRLEEDDDPEFTSPAACYAGTDSQHEVSGQSPGSWYYRAAASVEGEISPWSNTEWVQVRAWQVWLPLVMRSD